MFAARVITGCSACYPGGPLCAEYTCRNVLRALFELNQLYYTS